MHFQDSNPEQYISKKLLNETNINIQPYPDLNNYFQNVNYSAPQPQPITSDKEIQQQIPIPQYGPMNASPLQQQQINNEPNNPTTTQSDLLKDQPFEKQKIDFMKILALFIIGSVIEFFSSCCILGVIMLNKDLAPFIFFPLSLVLLIGLAAIGLSSKQFSKALLIFIGLMILSGSTLISFSRLLNHTKPPKEDGLYFTRKAFKNIQVADVVMLGVLLQIAINAVTPLLVIIQLIFEKDEVKYYPIILILGLASIIPIYISRIFIIFAFISVYYGFLLVNILNQVKKGRFNLKVNQLFANANSMYYGLIVPFYT